MAQDATADYRVIEVDLSTAVSSQLVQNLQGQTIYYIAALTLPAGAALSLSFGKRDTIPLSSEVRAFGFACGFRDGLYLTVPTAQPGVTVQLLVSFAPLAVFPVS